MELPLLIISHRTVRSKKMIAIIDYDCDYFLKSPIKKAFVRYKMK